MRLRHKLVQFRFLSSLWHRLRDRLGRERPRRLGYAGFDRIVATTSISESFRLAEPGVAILVRYDGHDKWLRFRCPEGCGDTIMLDLSKNRRPHWTVSLSPGGTLSVHPSIINHNCGAHFLVRENRIIWLERGRKGF